MRPARTAVKRKARRPLQFEEESPPPSPKRISSEADTTSKDHPISNETSSLALAVNTIVREPGDHRQEGVSSTVLPSSSDSTCLESVACNDGTDNHLQAQEEASSDKRKLSNSQLCVHNFVNQSQNLFVDSSALVDKLFDDSQPETIVPCSSHAAVSQSTSHSLPEKQKHTPSVSILGKVKLQSDFKSTVDTELNIDELLFGF